MRKFFLLLAAALVLFVGFTVAVTASYESAQPPVQPAPKVAIAGGAAERLAGSLRIQTISSEDPAASDADAFGTLHASCRFASRRAISSACTESTSGSVSGSTKQRSDCIVSSFLRRQAVEPSRIQERSRPRRWRRSSG
jgi:hypothetical protein